MNIVNLKEPANQSAVEYAQALWIRALRWGSVFDEYRLKGTFMWEVHSWLEIEFEAVKIITSQHCYKNFHDTPYPQTKVGQRHTGFEKIKTRKANASIRNCCSFKIFVPASSSESLAICFNIWLLTLLQLLPISELLLSHSTSHWQT